jgi:ribonucleoside-diphosphate reductase alpha chain
MSNLLPTDYQTFIATSRYARWLDKEGRRENWGETVSRYIDNIVKPVAGDNSYIKQIEEAILNLEVMPSMRSLMTAGPAAPACITVATYP